MYQDLKIGELKKYISTVFELLAESV